MAVEFKTLDEQIMILRKRNLIIDDEQKAKRYLLENNYHNVINCYGKLLQSNTDLFISGANIDEIRAINLYDTEIKQAILKATLQIERTLKSIFSYIFESHVLNKDYYSVYKNNKMPFTSSHNSYLMIHKTINKNIKVGDIQHYINRYNYIPMWVVLNYFTFGDLLKFYDELPLSIKNEISKEFSIYVKDNLSLSSYIFDPKQFVAYLENIKELRNISAHNNMLFGFKAKKSIKHDESIHSYYKIDKDAPRQDIYNTLILMQCFMTQSQYNTLHNTILKRTKVLQVKLKSIDYNRIISKLGFPENWIENTKTKYNDTEILGKEY